jgi:hypothetical protein
MGKLPTKTVHIRADLHRALKQMAAYEDVKLEEVIDRVLRFALHLDESQVDLVRDEESRVSLRSLAPDPRRVAPQGASKHARQRSGS